MMIVYVEVLPSEMLLSLGMLVSLQAPAPIAAPSPTAQTERQATMFGSGTNPLLTEGQDEVPGDTIQIAGVVSHHSDQIKFLNDKVEFLTTTVINTDQLVRHLRQDNAFLTGKCNQLQAEIVQLQSDMRRSRRTRSDNAAPSTTRVRGRGNFNATAGGEMPPSQAQVPPPASQFTRRSSYDGTVSDDSGYRR